MRHNFHHHPMPYRHFRRGFRPGFFRPYRRRGSLLGMIGLAALGYTLLDKSRQEQSRQAGYVDVDRNEDW